MASYQMRYFEAVDKIKKLEARCAVLESIVASIPARQQVEIIMAAHDLPNETRERVIKAMEAA